MSFVKILSCAVTIALVALITSGCDNELELETISIPVAHEGAFYQEAIKATGHHGDYSWHLGGDGLPLGLILVDKGETALIKGVPSTSGVFNFSISVYNKTGLSATKNYELTVLPQTTPPLLITTNSFPYGNSGVAYNTLVTATGGTGIGYRWAIVDKTLPPGLSVQNTGTPSTSISGTPTVSGSFEFTLQVRDNLGHFESAVLRIDIDAPLEILTPSFPRAMLGASYSQSIAASGGTGLGYTWSVYAGAIPDGLSLQSSGSPSTVLSGVPSIAQVYGFELEVRDSANNVARANFMIDVLPLLAINTPSVPDAELGLSYSQIITATGGAGSDFYWFLESGSLPTGMSFTTGPSLNTVVSGTPTALGTYPFQLRVEDQFGFSAYRNFQIEVSDSLEFVTQGMTGGTYGVPFNQSIAATGGSFSGYTWALFSGSLPPGLTLSSTGTPATTISGTPIQIGIFNFTIVLQDSNAETTSHAFSMNIAAGGALVVTTAVLPSAITGQAFSTIVSASGGTNGGYTWSVTQGVLHTDFTLGNSGSPNTTISGTPSSVASSSTITVQVMDGLGATATQVLVLSVYDPLQIVTASLPDADTYAPYVASISASGGNNSSYQWSILNGSLPQGVGLSPTGSTGDFSGTPTALGAFSFTVLIEDGTGQSATAALDIMVFGPGIIETVAGNGTAIYQGNGSIVTQTGLGQTSNVAFAPNGDMLFVSGNSHTAYRVDSSTNQVYIIAGDGNSGFLGDGFDASTARFLNPNDIEVDPSGNIYIADSGNNRIRRIDATTNIISTFAGGGTASGIGDGLVASLARLDSPLGVSWDNSGDLLIADSDHYRIRRVDMSTSVITTVAGIGAFWIGDGPVVSTGIGKVWQLDVAANGDLYFIDFSGRAVRRIVASTQMVETLSGNGSDGLTQPGSTAFSATLGRPYGIQLDSNGDVLFSEDRNHRLLKINLTTGLLEHVAGIPINAGMAGSYAGDLGPAVLAELNSPRGICIGPDGHLYLCDTGSSVVRRVRQ